jgi:parvulin-like peptidyl-prolyl isomerase
MIIRLFVLTLAINVILAQGVQAEETNPVVGKVGDFVLREADIDRLMSNQPAEAQKKLRDNPEERSNFIRQILLTIAVANKAKGDGFDRKPEVKEQLSYLADQSIAQQYLNRVVTANITVPDEDLKKYYQEHQQDFILPETVKARHIFIEAPKDASEELKKTARAKAEKILALAKKGEDFSRLARDYSEDAGSAVKGGELGSISPGKTNSDEFEKALFALKAGEIGNIVETPFGYHIIKVDDRKEKKTATFDEAREYIRNRLRFEFEQRKAQQFLDELTKSARVEVIGAKAATEKDKDKSGKP